LVLFGTQNWIFGPYLAHPYIGSDLLEPLRAAVENVAAGNVDGNQPDAGLLWGVAKPGSIRAFAGPGAAERLLAEAQRAADVDGSVLPAGDAEAAALAALSRLASVRLTAEALAASGLGRRVKVRLGFSNIKHPNPPPPLHTQVVHTSSSTCAPEWKVLENMQEAQVLRPRHACH
jgi:hypothetical protein